MNEILEYISKAEMEEVKEIRRACNKRYYELLPEEVKKKIHSGGQFGHIRRKVDSVNKKI